MPLSVFAELREATLISRFDSFQVNQSMKFAIPALSLSLALLAALPATAPAQESVAAERAADANAILDRLRMSQTLKDVTLTGRLRPAKGSKSTPFVLKLDGPVSTYTFTETGLGLRLSLGENASKIEEIGPDGAVKTVGTKNFGDHIGDTPVTYEDISLRFLYWPHAKIEGEESVNSFDCWKLWVATPEGTGSQYAGAYLWVGKGTGALMRADCYAPGSKLAKRFLVRTPQKIRGQWALKSMRIESYDPPGSVKPETSYLELDGEK
jgi:hypothetical protein